MLTVVSWFWRQRNTSILYKPEFVNVWANMVRRNLTIPHRLLCITTEPDGIEIDTYPLWEDFGINNPRWGASKPQCYRRLKAFSEEMRPILGDRFVSMDIDCVITGNLDEMLSRQEDFIINRGRTHKNIYNGSMWMMNTGARSHVWDEFRGEESVQQASRWMGSDQAWMREALGPDEATWGPEDGIAAYVHLRAIPKWKPKNTKIVFFQGSYKPWSHGAENIDWIRENWR
jgi:hypothetical protein